MDLHAMNVYKGYKEFPYETDEEKAYSMTQERQEVESKRKGEMDESDRREREAFLCVKFNPSRNTSSHRVIQACQDDEVNPIQVMRVLV